MSQLKFYYNCNNCGTMFQKIPSEETLKGIYTEKYNQILPDNPRFNEQLKLVSSFTFGLNNPIFLDVGCSFGFLLKKSNIECHGVEPYKPLRDRADKNLKIYDSLYKINEKYDLITLFDTIEHMTNPRGDMWQIRKLLKPHGKIIIETPDAGNYFVQKLHKEKWHYCQPNEHITLFSKKSLKMFLQQEGFKKIIFLDNISLYIKSLKHYFYGFIKGEKRTLRKKILAIAEV